MAVPDLEELTPRETEVLTQVALGYSLPEIAQQLHRSLKTIETHRLSLGRKLGASNRVELTRIAIAAGLAPLEHDPADLSPGENGEPQSPQARDLAGKARTLAHLEQINSEVLSATGPTYLRRLVTSISRILSVRMAGITQLENDDGHQVLRPIAICDGEAMLDPERYMVSCTPCENVLIDGTACYGGDVAAQFPEDQYLQDMHAESYCGVRLDNAQGDPIGVLFLIDDKPLDPELDPETILNFFAPRTGAELTQLAVVDRVRELSEELESKVEQRTQALRQATALYENLVENMTEGLCAMDTDHVITFANPRFCEMAGRSREELVGRVKSTDLMNEEDKAAFLGRQGEREAGTIGRYRLHMQRPDGSAMELLVSPRALFDEHGEFVGSFGIVTDMADVERSADA